MIVIFSWAAAGIHHGRPSQVLYQSSEVISNSKISICSAKRGMKRRRRKRKQPKPVDAAVWTLVWRLTSNIIPLKFPPSIFSCELLDRSRSPSMTLGVCVLHDDLLIFFSSTGWKKTCRTLVLFVYLLPLASLLLTSNRDRKAENFSSFTFSCSASLKTWLKPASVIVAGTLLELHHTVAWVSVSKADSKFIVRQLSMEMPLPCNLTTSWLSLI